MLSGFSAPVGGMAAFEGFMFDGFFDTHFPQADVFVEFEEAVVYGFDGEGDLIGALLDCLEEDLAEIRLDALEVIGDFGGAFDFIEIALVNAVYVAFDCDDIYDEIAAEEQYGHYNSGRLQYFA
jgi:hypothetical protein